MNILIVFSAKYLLYVSVIVAVAYFAKQPRPRQKEMLVFAVILLPFAYAIAKIAGHFYFDPRPFVVGHFTPLIPHAADNGFPSDHTLLASAVAATVFYFNKRLGLLLFVLALFVGAARVLAGVHHPMDIVGSFLAVLIVYIITDRFALWLKKGQK